VILVRYLEFPMLLRMAKQMGETSSVYLIGGPAFAFRRSAVVRDVADSGRLTDIAELVNGSNLLYIFGAGLQHKRWLVDARLTRGAQNVAVDPEPSGVKTNAFSVLMGVKIGVAHAFRPRPDRSDPTTTPSASVPGARLLVDGVIVHDGQRRRAHKPLARTLRDRLPRVARLRGIKIDEVGFNRIGFVLAQLPERLNRLVEPADDARVQIRRRNPADEVRVPAGDEMRAPRHHLADTRRIPFVGADDSR
jgi:hypothetical protein